MRYFSITKKKFLITYIFLHFSLSRCLYVGTPVEAVIYGQGGRDDFVKNERKELIRSQDGVCGEEREANASECAECFSKTLWRGKDIFQAAGGLVKYPHRSFLACAIKCKNICKMKGSLPIKIWIPISLYFHFFQLLTIPCSFSLPLSRAHVPPLCVALHTDFRIDLPPVQVLRQALLQPIVHLCMFEPTQYSQNNIPQTI